MIPKDLRKHRCTDTEEGRQSRRGQTNREFFRQSTRSRTTAGWQWCDEWYNCYKTKAKRETLPRLVILWVYDIQRMTIVCIKDSLGQDETSFSPFVTIRTVTTGELGPVFLPILFTFSCYSKCWEWVGFFEIWRHFSKLRSVALRVVILSCSTHFLCHLLYHFARFQSSTISGSSF